MSNTRQKILVVSVIFNLILSVWIYSLINHNSEADEELLMSQGRVQMLEENIDNLRNEYSKLDSLNSELSIEISNKPKERVVIKTVYDEKINDIIKLPIDSSISILSDRLSKIDID